MSKRPAEAIETRYAGCRFRSRLEARWAVFFTHHAIPWEYEPEGFKIKRADGSTTFYLPDFLLPDCGTWIEVKGAETELNKALLIDAAGQLPQVKRNGAELGPALMALGSVPGSGSQAREWPKEDRWRDWGWVGLDRHADELSPARYGFGAYHKNRRPWFLSDATNDAADVGWLTPVRDQGEGIYSNAYTVARSARFEHGEQG